jgi:ADP-ribosylglycohydrolase
MPSDTDTIGSIVGQLAGAATSSAGVPRALLAGISGIQEVQTVASQFAAFVERRQVGR